MSKEPNENHESDRLAIFIDGSNLYHSLDEHCHRFDLDFKMFSDKLCDNRSLYRVYYYNVLRDQDRNHQAYQDQQKFLGALYTTPFLEVRLGSSKVRGDTAVEKGVDIMIATDLLQMAWNDLYDTAVLVSGDGDYTYAVQAVKNLGKHVEIAAFSSNLAWELANIADNRILFTPEYFTDLWTKKRASNRSASDNGSSPAKKRWGFGRSRSKEPKKTQ
tara:strand:- start:33 stop:683 length:651 start_codon:yes stop_codon:yes gene_type:complete